MDFALIAPALVGALSAAALVYACVNEWQANKLAKNPRADKKLVEARYSRSDTGNVIAWVLLALAFLLPKNSAAAEEYQSYMTGVLLAVLAADIVFLMLRRQRPGTAKGRKQHLWNWWKK